MARPSSYKPEFASKAAKFCELGATDEEIAEILGVHTATFYRWKAEKSEFCEAVKRGKAPADERVERSLYQKSTGYYVTEEQAVKIKVGQYEEKVEVVEVRKYVPPDTTAQIFWLKNRRAEDWRDKREIEHSGSIDLNNTSDDELARIAGIGRSGVATAKAGEAKPH